MERKETRDKTVDVLVGFFPVFGVKTKLIPLFYFHICIMNQEEYDGIVKYLLHQIYPNSLHSHNLRKMFRKKMKRYQFIQQRLFYNISTEVYIHCIFHTLDVKRCNFYIDSNLESMYNKYNIYI
jgi:hypothetical protein